MLLAAGDMLEIPATFALVAVAAVGSALGSVARDWAVRAFRARASRADLGILCVNLLACVVVALVPATTGVLHALFVIGLAGGLSTWSSLAVEVAGAMRERRWALVALHVPGAFAMALAVFLAARVLAGGAS